MIKSLRERAKHVAGGEQGASNMEIIVWVLVVLVIAIALFAFRDQISSFLGSSTETVGNMDTKLQQTNGHI